MTKRVDWGNFNNNVAFLDKVALLNNRIKILEIGSGTGHLVSHLKKSGYDVVGIEINEKSIQIAKDKFNVELLKMGGDNLSFPDNYFDMVISFDVFEHVPDSDKHLEEVKRVLKDDGKYLLSTPNKWTNIPIEIISQKSFTKYKEYHCSLHNYWQLKKRFNKNGFNVDFIKILVVNEFFINKIKKNFGKLGLFLIKIINPDKLPLPMKTNFFLISKKTNNKRDED